MSLILDWTARSSIQAHAMLDHVSGFQLCSVRRIMYMVQTASA